MKTKSSSSCAQLFLPFLNLILLLLSSASLIPIFLLRNPPTSFGWALAVVSALTILSSLTGFCAQLAHVCFAAHTSLALTAALGHALGFLAFFLRPGPSMALLSSTRDPREAWVLVRAEEVALLGMFVLQMVAVVAGCTAQRWWVREYEEMEMEREEGERKRRWKMARVQEEAMENAAAAMEVRARELDEKLRKSNSYKFGRQESAA